MRKVEIKQLRIIINGYFCRVFKRLCFVIINGKKIQFIQNTDGANFLIQQVIFPVIKRKPNFPQPFLFRNGLLEFPVFRPNMLSSKFYFFRLESADSIAEKISTCLESMVLMVASKSNFTRFLVFWIRFIEINQKLKKNWKPQSLLTNRFRYK